MTDTITLPRATVQQALEALEWHYRQGHSNTLGGFRLKIDEKAIRTLKAALEQPERCSCGDRHKDKCPGEWEPGCDLGNNPAFARRVPLERSEQTNPWRDAVDDELSTLHMAVSDDPRESIRRLIDWHCAVQIDPLVSSAAQELIERGKREALEKLEQPTECRWLQEGDEESDTWAASCGRHRYFSLNDGTPTDNDMTHCCYCGKPLVEVPIEPEDNHD